MYNRFQRGVYLYASHRLHYTLTMQYCTFVNDAVCLQNKNIIIYLILSSFGNFDPIA